MAERYDFGNIFDVKETLLFDNDGLIHRIKTQDVEPVLEEVKAKRDFNNGYSKSRNSRHLASIPMTIWFDWLQQYGKSFYQDEVLLRRLLRDAGYAKFRVSEGGI